jgi:hypothetical protein
MRVAQLIVLVGTLAIAASACTRARASVEPEMPLLQPPPPPPRMVETYLEARPVTIEPEVVVESAAAIPPNKPTPRPTPPKPEAEKIEPPRVEPERTPPAPALTLKPPSGSETKTVASIRDLLLRASRDLARINYAALDADGRVQYDTARRFVQQSEGELKNGNVGLAGKLADKAATMAAVLVR